MQVEVGYRSGNANYLNITRNYFEGMKTAPPLTSMMMAIDQFWSKFALALLNQSMNYNQTHNFLCTSDQVIENIGNCKQFRLVINQCKCHHCEEKCTLFCLKVMLYGRFSFRLPASFRCRSGNRPNYLQLAGSYQVKKSE